jgi:hypothetical protein
MIKEESLKNKACESIKDLCTYNEEFVLEHFSSFL